ncbi:hypothetical protein HERIO_1568 [Hepatospora eriocheir]|uniref:Uncharacterized protein n=1 Tax=Hepatospora eriocheir TaxID=1081669 RepID=A0A1X0Q9P9_9MICR|nr:hypothetical protein HERIO_1568 [Hepatospora eriocheir]
MEYKEQILFELINKTRNYKVLEIDKSTSNKINVEYDVMVYSGISIDKHILKLKPDIFKIDISKLEYLKKSVINVCKENGIFIELVILDKINSDEVKINWLKALRKIVKFGGLSNLLITFESSLNNYKTQNDIIDMLKDFKVKNTTKLFANYFKCYRKIALKRFGYRNCLVAFNLLKKDVISPLKEDFILNFNKLL